MAADQAILREYLLALGFKINETEHKKFDTVVDKTDLRMTGLGKTVVGVAASVVAFTTLFAKSMERLYYTSRYAGTSAANLKALEFGAGQIGLKAGQATSAVTNMAAAIRANPGLIGLLTGKFGIPVAGRKMDEVMVDLVRVLRTMPPYIGQQFAAMFGIDPETLFNMSLGLEKMEKAKDLQKEMAKQMGVNLDEAAQMGVEYGNAWRTMTEHASLFVALLGISLMPKMKELASTTHDLMNDWAKIVQDINKTGTEDFWKRMREGLGLAKRDDGAQLTPEAALRAPGPVPHTHTRTEWLGIPRMMEDWNIWRTQRSQKRLGTGEPRLPFSGPAGDAGSERGPAPKPGAPSDTRPRATSGAGDPWANLPPPQPGTTLHLGGSPEDVMMHIANVTDPQDRSNLYYGYMAQLQEQSLLSSGRYGLGAAPKQARDSSAGDGAPVTVTQNTDIHIHGAEKPREAGDAVYEAMESVNAETLRNFIPKVR